MTEKNKKETPQSQPEHEDMNVLMVRRREELDHLKQMGINPYPALFERKNFSIPKNPPVRDKIESKISGSIIFRVGS